MNKIIIFRKINIINTLSIVWFYTMIKYFKNITNITNNLLKNTVMNKRFLSKNIKKLFYFLKYSVFMLFELF